jgi:AmmeMemoRadiSam system protein B/AmmeMemoRadiSam system protein A
MVVVLDSDVEAEFTMCNRGSPADTTLDLIAPGSRQESTVIKSRIAVLRYATIVYLLVLVPFVACSNEGSSHEGGSAEMESSTRVREPAVAGAFYPGTEKALRDAVSGMLAAVEPREIKGKVIGLISPHAGYIYSGQVAANGYRLVKGRKFDAVIVIAPSHHVYFEGSSVYTLGPYRTPLGLVEIHKDLAEAIVNSDESIGFHAAAHAREHSLEVQLPFLQMTVPDLRLVPIVMGDQSLDACRRLARAIVSNVKDMNVLLVASSDLSHFHPYDEAVRLDRILIDDIEHYDYEGLADDLEAGRCEACGGGPIITVMIAGKDLGVSEAVTLKYANSGDVTHDKSGVVGYVAVALVEETSVGVDLGIRHAEKVELLDLARRTIEAKILGKPLPDSETDSPRLKEKMGAFVTITKHGQLRGCIGHIRGTEPLNTTISKMAIAAATEDPRFPPLSPGELDDISLEISVLTPFRKIASPDEIQVGRDGIYIEKGFNHGLLLPQVATEYGWTRDEFLDHTCLKAGLPKGDWREGADIYIFSAQVFNEKDLFGGSSSQREPQ